MSEICKADVLSVDFAKARVLCSSKMVAECERVVM